MRLATVRVAGAHQAVRVEDTAAVPVGFPDLVALLQQPDWRELAAGSSGEAVPLDELDYAPLVPRPEKILCVGLNYRHHIQEMGRELPTHPTLFAKYARSLVGAHDPVVLPAASDAVDWEAELGVVVGAPVRNADRAQARAAIAGVTVVNDVTGRDWQNRTLQWLSGKTFENSTPVGPWLVTDDAAIDGSHALTCEVDGERVQQAQTGDLVFDAADLVAYASTMITLVPGDLIATGTPGGVGHACTPPRYLHPGAELVTSIEGVGQCRNRCRAETGP